jgi:beta-glucosidase
LEVTIENKGEHDGAEVIQVYIEPQNPSVGRPVKELKGFEKKKVIKQSSATVTIEMELKYALGFWDEAENCWVCERGNYNVVVGTSSRGKNIRENLHLEKTFWWKGL